MRPVSVLALAAAAASLLAADWPEWRGAGRRGEFTESGLADRFPAEGLRLSWRAPVNQGYSGPAVSQGRVFLTDYDNGTERALAFDERTGRRLWSREWPADYRGLDYAGGPRATPTADGDHVYVLGAMGRLVCLRTADGAIVWETDFRRDYRTEVPTWGMTAAPLVDGPRLIAVAAGRPDAKIVALDKLTGKEMWRALSSESSEPGYSQPILMDGGRRLVFWHAGAVAALDPATGATLWEHPWRIHMNTPIATPVEAGRRLLVSAFFQGTRLLAQSNGELVWRGKSDSEVASDTLHALLNSPMVDGEYIYGFCAQGQLRCLKLATGERVWESQQAAVERTRNVSAFLVRNGPGRYYICNDRGDLILARLRPSGYEELSRARIIEPTSKQGSRRELAAVAWSHPAFANGHVIVRNDREVVRWSLRP